jgi:hypothetical protein
VDGMGAALGSTVILFWDRTLGRQLLEGHRPVRPAPALCAYPRRETGVVVRHWYPCRCVATQRVMPQFAPFVRLVAVKGVLVRPGRQY